MAVCRRRRIRLVAALTLRTGVNYEISPVDGATTRLVQDPDSNRVWASIGASYKTSADTRWDFSYSHVFFEDNAPFDRVGAVDAVSNPVTARHGGRQHGHHFGRLEDRVGRGACGSRSIEIAQS